LLTLKSPELIIVPREFGTLAVDGWAVTFGTARRGLAGRGPSPPRPLLAVTACPSTASVPITALLYSDPLLCGFNMSVKRLKLECFSITL